jgi:hypothetical protein
MGQVPRLRGFAAPLGMTEELHRSGWQWGYRSNLNPGLILGRSALFAANHPVKYIHCAMRVSFG